MARNYGGLGDIPPATLGAAGQAERTVVIESWTAGLVLAQIYVSLWVF